jgi:hypothetical protein
MTEASSLAEDLDSDDELDFDFCQDGRRMTPASLLDDILPEDRKSDTEQQRQSAIEQRHSSQHSPRGPQYVTRTNEKAQDEGKSANQGADPAAAGAVSDDQPAPSMRNISRRLKPSAHSTFVPGE